MVPTINVHHCSYQIHDHIYIQPFMYSPYQDHAKLTIHHIKTFLNHAYSPISYYNITIQSSIYQTLKIREETEKNTHSRPILAQAEETRSSERFPSLRRAPFAQARARKEGTIAFVSSRLVEPFSPERDGLSLKIEACRLSDSSHRLQGKGSGTLT